MDQALKQRLVGATVLIALGVILLPMLLSGQPELQNETARIEVPEKPPELSIETRRFPVGERGPAQPSLADEREPADPASQAGRDEDAAPGDDPAPVPAAPTAAVEEAAELAAESPAARRPAEPQPAMNAERAGGRYLVQVASFSNPGNANNLAALLRENQLPVVLDNVVTGAGRLHRVRVGPFDELAAADASAERIRAMLSDLSPRVVDLRPDENAPVTDPSDPLVRWVVQAGSFAEEANAAELSAQLRDAGFAAFVETVSDASGTAWKVKVGPVIERQSAVQLAAELEQKLAIDGLVMSVD
jgi:DedD protein